jgi:hypothetical protein
MRVWRVDFDIMRDLWLFLAVTPRDSLACLYKIRR